MSVLQVAGGPIQLDLPNNVPYESGIAFAGPAPPAPFDSSKREYWAIADGQQPVFGGQSIGQIATMQGVSATSCTDFAKYLRGKNGGPPSYDFSRYAYYDAKLADHPDQFGANPSIPGWTTSVNHKITFTGTSGGKGFQGVLLRRWAQNLRNFEEYWLLDAPNGGLAPGATVAFSNQVASSALPRELVTTFPNMLPNPQGAGPLSGFFFWHDTAVWNTLDEDPGNWQSQICG
jgi:hypothetical protein